MPINNLILTGMQIERLAEFADVSQCKVSGRHRGIDRAGKEEQWIVIDRDDNVRVCIMEDGEVKDYADVP